MEFLYQYGLYLAQVATLVAAILIVVITIMTVASKGKAKAGKLRIKKLNQCFEDTTQLVHEATQTKHALKQIHKTEKQAKKREKAKKHNKPNLFVLHFNGDIKASAVAALREEITAILLAYQANDEVLLCLESPGGMVHAYGLAASQLQRLKAANIKLTIAVDKVAASGGYMMACLADHIIAAPFAVVGSIGVIAQLPNFHRYLSKKSIDFEQVTAGEYKRTLTMFGENTKQGRQKFQSEMDDVHELFKSFIQQYRELDIKKVATGEHWYATRAIELNLVDELQTSDDFLLKHKDDFQIIDIQYKLKKSWTQRLGQQATQTLAKLTHPTNGVGGTDYLP